MTTFTSPAPVAALLAAGVARVVTVEGTCATCEGQGLMFAPDPSPPPMVPWTAYNCPDCRGSGIKPPDVQPGDRVWLAAEEGELEPLRVIGPWRVYATPLRLCDHSWRTLPRPAIPLHPGHVVGSATVETVVPVVAWGTDEPLRALLDRHDGHFIAAGHGNLHEWQRRPGLDGPDSARCSPISDQLPYADFTPGRYAIILTDAAPCDPHHPDTEEAAT